MNISTNYQANTLYNSLLVANPYSELPAVEHEVAHESARTVLHKHPERAY